MKFSKLELLNFRCFENHKLELGMGFNLIIGNNARGKTSLLEAMTIAARGIIVELPVRTTPTKPTRKHFDVNDVRHLFLMQGQTLTAEPQYPCTINFSGDFYSDAINWTGELKTTKPFWNVQISSAKSSDGTDLRDPLKELASKVLAGENCELPLRAYYGTERLWLSHGDIETVAPESRFSGYIGCLDSRSNVDRFFEWFKTQELVALQKNTEIRVLEACRKAITTCVPGSTHVYFDVSRNGIILLINDEPVPFEFLSDGYRNMLAMVGDIAIRCATLNPHLEAEAASKTTGVVMIDEIDLHLHPKWQRQVVGDLMTAFPNIQFVATTHSPFVIQSLPPNKDVRLINLDGGELEDLTNRSVEDIVEWVQGVEQPQRSKRHLEMMERAAEYFSMLEDDSDATKEVRQAKRIQLEDAIQPFSDDPAYSALIRMQQLAKEGNKNGGASLRRERKPKSDNGQQDPDEPDNGNLMEGGTQ